MQMRSFCFFNFLNKIQPFRGFFSFSLSVHEAEQFIQVDLIVFGAVQGVVDQLLQLKEDFLVRHVAVFEFLFLLRWVLALVFIHIEQTAKVPDGIVCLPFINLSLQLALACGVHTLSADRQLPGLRFARWLLADVGSYSKNQIIVSTYHRSISRSTVSGRG